MKKINFRDKRKIFIFILVYGLIITSYFSLRTFSKFISVANNKTGTKDVAKWDVTLDTSSAANSIDLVSGNTTNTQDYILTVSSLSDVAVECELVVSNLPTGVSMKIDNDVEYTQSSGIIRVNNFCTFVANDSNTDKSYILTFIAPLNSNVVSNRTININVSCKQKSI